MPCYYTGSEAGDRELVAAETRDALTEVTRLLCKAGKIFSNHPEIKLPEELKVWFRNHDAIDAKRS